MSDDLGAPAADAATAPEVVPVADTGGDISLRQAAQLLSQARRKPTPAPVEQPTADPVEPNELAQADADPPQEAPSEATDEAEPAELPPIDPPRSWTKAEKERFQALPRETQEYLHTREQERDRDVRRSQNEVAEERKAVKAEREAAEKARQQYEAQLPSVMQALQDAQNGAFADVRTVDDVTRLANEDPFRYLQWQAHQTKLQAVNAELERAKGEKTRAEQAEWVNYTQKQTELAAEFIPELADKVKGQALVTRAGERMRELGFSQDELTGFTRGEKISPYDHRFQRLLANDLKLSDIQNAKTAVAQKPLPPVQRPGTSKPQGSGVSSTLQALQDKFNRDPSLKNAQALHAAEARHKRRS